MKASKTKTTVLLHLWRALQLVKKHAHVHPHDPHHWPTENNGQKLVRVNTSMTLDLCQPSVLSCDLRGLAEIPSLPVCFIVLNIPVLHIFKKETLLNCFRKWQEWIDKYFGRDYEQSVFYYSSFQNLYIQYIFPSHLRVCMYIMVYYSAFKRGILPFKTNLDNGLLCEIIQTKKENYCLIIVISKTLLNKNKKVK